MSNVFELNNITYSYSQSEPLLKNLSLKVSEGENVSILGANGSGKSTLLKIFAGLIFPQSGVFTAFGDKIEQDKFKGKVSAAYHRRVGFVFQDSEAQLFCSTVYEELAFGPLQLSLPAETVRKRIAELSSMLGIEKLLNKPPFRLSGGEKKKVAIGSILILNPDVLILDEPANNLDPRSQSWLLHLLKLLGDAGKTMIFSTHNLDLVPQVCKRAVLLDENHEVAADMPAKVLLKNAELLKRVNLVDEHYHTHPWDFE